LIEEGGGYREGQMSSMRRGEEQIVYIVEMSRVAEVRKGAAVQQIFTSTRINR
jgi:hypothetical protein